MHLFIDFTGHTIIAMQLDVVVLFFYCFGFFDQATWGGLQGKQLLVMLAFILNISCFCVCPKEDNKSKQVGA